MTRNLKILFAVIIVFATLISIGIILLLCSGFNDKYDITVDPNRYNEVITGEKWGLSEEIFPDNIEEKKVLDFRHVYYDLWDANYLAYLVVDYSEDDYQKELERLHQYGISEYIGYYGVTGFSNYKLIAMEADSYQGFVYAITDEKSKVIYVEMIFCNYYMDIKYDSQIPNEYLPDGFNAKKDNPYQKSKR